MNPPTRSSILCPSSVWVLMIVPLVRVELAGLVDDLLGDRDLADVVQERGELEVAPPLGAQAEPVRHVEGQRDDAAAVLAGVAVVGLDDVAEHQGGAAVGVAQLERALQAPATLVGEHGEETEQRHDRERAEDHVVGGLGGEQPGRRRARRPPRTPTSLSVARRSWLGPRSRIGGRRSTKSTTNCAENATISRPAWPCVGVDLRDREHGRGPSANQALETWSSNRLGRLVPRMIPGTCASDEGDRDRDRHDRGRHREQERDERQLSWRP